MLTPVLVLIVWTLIIWIWMYATRIPAMQAAKMDPQEGVVKGAMNTLPVSARVVADNYNHLHEQPVLFYALAFYVHLAGVTDGLMVALAWAYVGLRIVHSFAQIIAKKVVVRFGLFALGTLALMAIAVRSLLAL